jgi:hypothetical protein
MRFPYHHESPLPAVILSIVCLSVGLILPPGDSRTLFPVLRIVVLGTAFIYLAWAGLQLLLRSAALQVLDDQIVVQSPTTWRLRHIPFAAIEGYIKTRRNALAIFYWQRRSNEKPKRRVLVTASLADSDSVLAALAPYAVAAKMPIEVMRDRLVKRMIVRAILGLLILASIPVVLVGINRFLMGFRTYF